MDLPRTRPSARDQTLQNQPHHKVRIKEARKPNAVFNALKSRLLRKAVESSLAASDLRPLPCSITYFYYSPFQVRSSLNRPRMKLPSKNSSALVCIHAAVLPCTHEMRFIDQTIKQAIDRTRVHDQLPPPPPPKLPYPFFCFRLSSPSRLLSGPVHKKKKRTRIASRPGNKKIMQ